LRTIERIAADAIPVLVVGETGTGKELVADEIHRRSGRGAGPLVRIDGSSSRADTALEPDADGQHALLRERGGTIVIDEVCELSSANQARLARLLEAAERAAESATDLPRFVATTNRDLEAEVAAGRFRIDLYHRLDGVTLVVPPLRQRIDDIEPLARRFAEEAAARLGRGEAPTLSEVALARLQSYRWPGNVRELKNVVRRAVLLADGPVILPPHLPLEKLAAAFAPEDDEDAGGGLSQVREQFQAVERQRIALALQRAGGNQTEAAKLLGIARRTLIKRLDQYDLPRPRKQK
jgi:DNA-binding NtrC family response regulator